MECRRLVSSCKNFHVIVTGFAFDRTLVIAVLRQGFPWNRATVTTVPLTLQALLKMLLR